MVFASALAAGAVLGIRHALEADHLAAVTTLVDSRDRSGYVGALWGVGHSLPIAGLGLLFVAFGVRLPASVTRFFEFVVGFVLLFLGIQLSWAAVRRARVQSHDHGDGHHSHLQIRSLSVGLTHSHREESSFLIGVLHGFAGSGALVIALVSTAPTISTALSFLGGFSVLSIVTMALVSTLWGRLVGTRFTIYLKGTAGAVSICVGVLLLTEQIGLGLL
ncbi:hypothetical protein [Haloarcula nitratireducens]|uniref:High-affinity nickel-transporter protein n=1 Tax=Haloarcula nitratireducens TaxID=2487749 RepID=A0AAW4PIR9_9EURY|nr:hypothetical protein [Halomicroarcula nitratireducens]MBX0298022.1 hypothetical protein [Halomicroarcula nitratireducens]